MKKNKWYLYIILTTNDKLYTGITTDLERRFSEHQSGIKGAKFLKANPPKEIVHTEEFHSRAEASRREIEIKKLSRDSKNLLIRKKSVI